MSDKRKIYVVDTSSIIDDPRCMETLGKGGNVVVIPEPVLRELDRKSKSREDWSAREQAKNAIRTLSELRDKKLFYPDPATALEEEKSSFSNGGKLSWYLPKPGDFDKYKHQMDSADGPNANGDDPIIASALSIRHKFPELEVIMMSEDMNLRLRADCNQLKAEQMRDNKPEITEFYTGYTELLIDPSVIKEFLDSEKELSKKKIDISRLAADADISKLVQNQGVKLIDRTQSKNTVLARYNHDTKTGNKCLRSLGHATYWDSENKADFESNRIKANKILKIRPGDSRQILYMEYLLDPDINLLAVNGTFGTGKTKLLIAAALRHVCPELNIKEEPDLYSNGICILRPEQPAGDYEIGWLPGDVKDKIDPFLEPYYQAISSLGKMHEERDLVKKLLDAKRLTYKATSYLRGQDITDTFLCMDETQNGNMHLAILFLSRVSQGTKTVVLGDRSQIDNRYVGERNNALTLVTEAIRFRPNPGYAVITLTENYRKGPAEAAQSIIDMVKKK